MKFKYFYFIFLLSCSPQFSTINQKKPYTAKGLHIFIMIMILMKKLLKEK